MATSKKAVAKYKKKTYDQILLLVKSGRRAEIKASAAKVGLSVNEFINKAIESAEANISTNEHPPD
jgi:predicted HicB family RNase H-like nuclease